MAITIESLKQGIEHLKQQRRTFREGVIKADGALEILVQQLAQLEAEAQDEHKTEETPG